MSSLDEMLAPHLEHEWREVPPCVYCVPCDVRLYQGSIPASKDPELAAKRAACKHDGEHERYEDEDGWHEMGEGFYWICADCGYKGWYE
jgi:hypothetical protein